MCKSQYGILNNECNALQVLGNTLVNLYAIKKKPGVYDYIMHKNNMENLGIIALQHSVHVYQPNTPSIRPESIMPA